jgi:hypothetical protein
MVRGRNTRSPKPTTSVSNVHLNKAFSKTTLYEKI